MLGKKAKRINELEEDKAYLISKNERLERQKVEYKNRLQEVSGAKKEIEKVLDEIVDENNNLKTKVNLLGKSKGGYVSAISKLKKEKEELQKQKDYFEEENKCKTQILFGKEETIKKQERDIKNLKEEIKNKQKFIEKLEKEVKNKQEFIEKKWEKKEKGIVEYTERIPKRRSKK